MLLPENADHFTRTQSWKDLVSEHQLSALQQTQFEQYGKLLIEWNRLFNITAITDPEKIIQDHFQDSLALSQAYDLATIQGLADIGSGGGLPGIPLKIKYPHIPIILVEVTQKKISFLNHVITALELPLIEIYPFDWRTFVRKQLYDIDIICARASLRPDELSRMFNPENGYNQATLVYWASIHWTMSETERPYFNHDYSYTIAHKPRKLIFFTKNN